MTLQEAKEAFVADLSGGKRNHDTAVRVCEVWNREKHPFGGVFGNGFHVRDGRVIRNPYDYAKEIEQYRAAA